MTMKQFILACLILFAGASQAADNPIGTGDMLHVTVYGNPDLTTDARVTAGGTISFPLVGEVKVGGISVPMAERKISNLLEDGRFIKRPQVNIVVTQFVSQQVSVLGEVQRPGRYPLDRPSTLTDLLAIAGGIGPNGSDQITVISLKDGKSIRLEYDLQNMFRKNGTPDVWVSAGDIIYVPRAPVFYIYGEVQHPGVFRLDRDMVVAQAIATGGGLTPRGTERGLRIKRRNAKGVLETFSAEATTQLLANDVLQVQESLF
jgi:polysaccharide export outer membrane protein